MQNNNEEKLSGIIARARLIVEYGLTGFAIRDRGI